MNIKAIKESIQIFSRKAATKINWPLTDKEIECAIDDNIVECSEMDSPPYTGIPAPAVLQDDSWFGSAPDLTEKQKEYQQKQQEATERLHEDIRSETKESEDIHQVMYDMATQNAATTLQLDPIGGSENFQGGSENVHR